MKLGQSLFVVFKREKKNNTQLPYYLILKHCKLEYQPTLTQQYALIYSKFLLFFVKMTLTRFCLLCRWWTVLGMSLSRSTLPRAWQVLSREKMKTWHNRNPSVVIHNQTCAKLSAVSLIFVSLFKQRSCLYWKDCAVEHVDLLYWID